MITPPRGIKIPPRDIVLHRPPGALAPKPTGGTLATVGALPPRSLGRRIIDAVLPKSVILERSLIKRIQDYIDNGDFATAANLLFFRLPAKTARKLIADQTKHFEESKSLATALSPLVRQIMANDSRALVLNEDLITGLLLQHVPAPIATDYLQALAEPAKAAQILGVIGYKTYTPKREIISRSLAGPVLASLLLRGEETTDALANALVSSGLNNSAFAPVYRRSLNELHGDFHEALCSAEEYEDGIMRASLFRDGKNPFTDPNPNALTTTKLQPFMARLNMRQRLEQLYEEKDFDLLWSIATDDKEVKDAFADLTTLVSAARVISHVYQREPEQVFRLIVEVWEDKGSREVLLLELSRLFDSNAEDGARFFIEMIESDRQVLGRKDCAYDILLNGATALENVNDRMMNHYQAVLIEIEVATQERGNWLSADTFLTEGRFQVGDLPQSATRTARVDFYRSLVFDETKPEADRVYALKMLYRLRAFECLLQVRRMLGRRLTAGQNDLFTMTCAKVLFDLCEALDVSRPEQRKMWGQSTSFLYAASVQLEKLVASQPEITRQVLVTEDGERSRQLRLTTIKRNNNTNKQIVTLKKKGRHIKWWQEEYAVFEREENRRGKDYNKNPDYTEYDDPLIEAYGGSGSGIIRNKIDFQPTTKRQDNYFLAGYPIGLPPDIRVNAILNGIYEKEHLSPFSPYFIAAFPIGTKEHDRDMALISQTLTEFHYLNWSSEIAKRITNPEELAAIQTSLATAITQFQPFPIDANPATVDPLVALHTRLFAIFGMEAEIPQDTAIQRSS